MSGKKKMLNVVATESPGHRNIECLYILCLNRTIGKVFVKKYNNIKNDFFDCSWLD